MFYISVISDAFFYATASFFLSFILINFYLKKTLALIFGAIIFALVFLLCFKISSSKKRKRKDLEKENREISDSLDILCLKEYKDLLSVFYECYKKTHPSAVKCDKYILLKDENVRVFPIFNFEGLYKSDVVKVFNYLSDQSGLILTNEISNEVKDFVLRFRGKIKVLSKKEVYSLLVNSGLTLKSEYSFLRTPEKKPNYFKNFFNKKRAVKFLLFGSIFVILSFFVPYKIYYLAFGTVLIIFSAISRFFGKTTELS